MFFKVFYMELKKSLLRVNTIVVLLLILSVSFISAVNFKNGVETGKYQSRLDEIITKKENSQDKLIDKLNESNDAAEKIKIKDQIKDLNINKLSREVLKSPFQVINSTVFNLLYLSIIIGILFGDIFSREYSTNIESLMFSSKTSRKSIVISKLLSSCVIITIVNLLFFLLCYLMGLLFLKDTSFNVPMQQLIGMESIKSTMTVIQYIVIGFLYSNLICFLFVSLIVLISSLTKNYIFPVFSGIILGFITMMSASLWMDYPNIMKFIPTSYLDFSLFIRLKSIHHVTWYLPFILIVSCTVIFVALTHFRIYKKQVC